MAIPSVLKVENKALKITDDFKVPVIVATISGASGDLSAAEAYQLNLLIAAQMSGAVSAVGYQLNKRNSEAQYQLIASLPNQGADSVYGDDEGFKLTVQARTYTAGGGDFASCSLYLSYLGNSVSQAYTYGFYSEDEKFEASFIPIYVSEQNELIKSSSNRIEGINIVSENELPLRMHKSAYLVSQYNGELPRNVGYQSLYLYNTNHSMDDDLTDPNDPFDDDDDSDTGGGSDGSDQDNWDNSGDEIPVPGLPDLSAVDTGFITLYNPTVAQLQSLASYMWSSAFDISAFRKIVADPMDVILGLSIVPVDVPASSTAEVNVGNIGTGVYMLKASSQYVEVDCGTIDVHEKDHSYLDYAPYTKVTLILPYIGAQELSIDEINGQTLGVKYHVDILSGACVAFVTIGGNVVHQYAGQCAVSIPITSKDFTQTIQAICQLVGAGIGAGVGIAASGGMSAPITAAMVAGGVSAAASGAMNVVNSKPTFSKTGSIAGSAGLLAVQKPYLIFERPKKCKPAEQQTYTGYPSILTRSLGSLSGFTQVRDIHLNGIPCTDSEFDEILKLMREGIIL